MSSLTFPVRAPRVNRPDLDAIANLRSVSAPEWCTHALADLQTFGEPIGDTVRENLIDRPVKDDPSEESSGRNLATRLVGFQTKPGGLLFAVDNVHERGLSSAILEAPGNDARIARNERDLLHSVDLILARLST